MIRLRFEERSYDLNERELELVPSIQLSDEEIKAHLACYLDIARIRLDGYIVDRRPSGDLVVCPEAVY